jgi:hypothetical protein
MRYLQSWIDQRRSQRFTPTAVTTFPDVPTVRLVALSDVFNYPATRNFILQRVGNTPCKIHIFLSCDILQEWNDVCFEDG